MLVGVLEDKKNDVDKMLTTDNKKRKKTIHKMNKKGFVWADLVGAFQRAVGWFLDTVPRPIKLLLFLLFLLGFVSIFGFLLNSSGNFCDTNGNLYQTGFFSMTTNLELLSSMPDEADLGKNELVINEAIGGLIEKCQHFLISPYYYVNGTKVYLAEGSREYYDGGYCTDCDTELLISNGTGSSGNYCINDGETIPYDKKNWIKKQVCGTNLGGCEPPSNYYYSYIDNAYVCTDLEVCGNMTIGQQWNDRLRDTGAKITPASDSSNRDFQNAVGVECDVASLQPQFKFFGIKIFDYKLWVAIYLLMAVIWMVYKIKYKS